MIPALRLGYLVLILSALNVRGLAMTEAGNNNLNIVARHPHHRGVIACAQLFAGISKPFLFTLERDGKTQFLFGSTNQGSTISSLPVYVQDLIGRMPVVVVDHIFDEGMAEPVQVKAPTQEEILNRPETGLNSKLNTKAAFLLRRFLDEIPDPIFDRLQVSELMGLLNLVLGSIFVAPDQAVRFQQIHKIVTAIQPPLTAEELGRVGNLAIQIQDAVKRQDHELIGLMTPGEAQAMLSKAINDIDKLEKFVFALERIRQRPINHVYYEKGRLAEFEQMNAIMRQVAPQSYLELANMAQNFAPLIERIHSEREKALYSFDINLLVGNRGLIHYLEREGFSVKRVKSESDISGL